MHISEQNEADGEEIDLVNWKKTFFGELTNLEYTTNSLGHYNNGTNTSVVIDLSGSGHSGVEDTDTCNKTIKIPLPCDPWVSWYNDDSSKIFRNRKLRAKGTSQKTTPYPHLLKTQRQKSSRLFSS
jgi:hypothetical protein